MAPSTAGEKTGIRKAPPRGSGRDEGFLASVAALLPAALFCAAIHPGESRASTDQPPERSEKPDWHVAVGAVTTLKGELTRRTPSWEIPVGQGDKLLACVTYRTGPSARATFHLDTGEKVYLGPDSVLELGEQGTGPWPARFSQGIGRVVCIWEYFTDGDAGPILPFQVVDSVLRTTAALLLFFVGLWGQDQT